MSKVGTRNWQGMNWIRQEKRLAIYLRDGCACAWCGAKVEDESTKLTLDHVIPHCDGGSNDASNLVTCCKRCNESRGIRSIAKFSTVVSAYIGGAKPATIRAHIIACTKRDLKVHLVEAKALMSRRGSALDCLKGTK